MNQTSMWALTAAGFFLVGLGIVITQPEAAAQVNPISRLNYVAQLCFIGFHLAMLPVITNLNAPTWAKGAGYAWIAVDNAICVMTINGIDNAMTGAIRLGIHVAAGTWILLAALGSTNTTVRWLGAIAGVWLGGYSLVAPFVPSNLFMPAALLLLVWVATIGFVMKPKPEMGTAPAPMG
jgi:hypothetical protein